MPSLITTLLTLLFPLIFLILPGLALVPPTGTISARIARIVLWSITGTMLATFIITVLHIPLWLTVGLWIGALSIVVLRRPHLTRASSTSALLLVAGYGLLALPLLQHNLLPTGDIQKSIIWAQDIVRTTNLPNYDTATLRLNRDPVDFYTPALHTFTALIFKLAPHPLTTAALTAVSLSLAVVVVAVALARLLAPTLPALSVTVFTAFLLLTQLRFLRYIREPGYHYQNIIGELLLFGSLFLMLSLLKQWRWRDGILLTTTLSMLVLSHQFSAFLAAFVLLPTLVLLGYKVARHKRTSRQALTILGVVIIVLMAAGVSLDLHHKVDDIFTTEPHLLDLNPALADYPRLMGSVWLSLGLGGFIYLISNLRRRYDPVHVAFIAAVGILLLLSQGPRLFVDIPPVRTLFYLAVPLSICAAVWLAQLWQRATHTSTQLRYRLLLLTLMGTMVASSSITLTQALTVTHSVRTNSTLTPGQLNLVSVLKDNSLTGNVLVDDYNRRSSSWLVLSERPMFTRIASDLERQMSEARQSPLRYQLYLNQLDYEKIFSLASQPFITQLLDKHHIAWITGIAKSSASGFQANPALRHMTTTDDISLFTMQSLGEQEEKSSCPNQFSETDQTWLLRASTLVNDIGDDEDTFAHLPASLRTTRLSSPERSACRTTRTTTAPLIPLVFNVGDYATALWDQELTHQPNVTLEALIRFDAASPLTLRTSTNYRLPLALTSTTARLPAQHLPIDDQGFITLFLENPAATPVTFDLIALGLARVP